MPPTQHPDSVRGDVIDDRLLIFFAKDFYEKDECAM
jgi:hypothetical protein